MQGETREKHESGATSVPAAQTALEWEEYIHHPCLVGIIGGRGEGKTVTMCSILDAFHGKDVLCCLIAPREVHRHYPRWIRRVDPKRLDVPVDSVCAVDDAHLYFYARDWAGIDRENHKILDFLNRESRHKDITFIYTTQQTRVLDVNLVSMFDVVIVKKPSLLQNRFERREVQRLIGPAAEALAGTEGKKYAYVYSRAYEGLVGPYDQPRWYTAEISRSYRGKKLNTPTNYTWVGKLVKETAKIIRKLPL